MRPTARRLATFAILLALGVAAAGCATPEESAGPEDDAGNVTDQDAGGNETVQPSLPGFDPRVGGGDTTSLP